MELNKSDKTVLLERYCFIFEKEILFETILKIE